MPQASSSPQCAAFWTHCLNCLEQELPAQQFKTWILPLRAEELAGDDNAGLRLVAPSNFHRQWLRDRYLRRIEELGEEFFGGLPTIEVSLAPAGGLRRASPPPPSAPAAPSTAATPAPGNVSAPPAPAVIRSPAAEAPVSPDTANYDKSRLNPDFTFDTLVTGRANDLARAAALQVAQNPGVSYNPLFIYGGVGLGKTHLIHALGNTVFKADPRKVI
ncbi:MAG: chromosomal replication initiator protein DnaA, partial [Zoogloea sp.]